MVKLTFHGGVNEIGGNKILLEDRGTRIFLDFGKSFSCGERFFTSWLSPRPINGLGDYFEFDLLPRMSGLYSKEQLTSTDLDYVEPEIDAIFLSHAHFDHVDHIQFLDPQIPIHLGEGTKFFLEAMEKTSSFCDYRKHEYHTFRTGKKAKVGDLVVEPIHVDHSIPSSYGFIIHTSKGTIVYTGDLRIHGPRNDMTKDFVEKACSCEPVALICEGTRMVKKEKRTSYSEKQVKQLAEKVVSSTDHIVFTTHYSRDMDRFRTFYTIAKENHRKIVISPKKAYLLNRLVEDKRLDLPNPLKDENILVYYKRKKSGKFEESDYYRWEREFIDKKADYEFVQKNQEKLLMELGFYQFAELIDVRPDPGSHFIHSMSEPFSEEDIEDEIMHNWLDHFKIQFHQLHASGHMNKEQLTEMIKNIQPKCIFPIHTESQRFFKKNCNLVKIIQRRKEYTIQ